MNTGTCTESTIPTRGRETFCALWTQPAFILYRNKNYKYIYNYDWLYICTIIHRYILHSYIVRRLFSLLSTYQPRARCPRVCIHGTPLYSTVLPYSTWQQPVVPDSTTPPEDFSPAITPLKHIFANRDMGGRGVWPWGTWNAGEKNKQIVHFYLVNA